MANGRNEVSSLPSAGKMFIGLNNIASQIPDYARAFNRLGVETLTVTYGNHNIIENKGMDFVVEDRIPEIAWFSDKKQGKELRTLVARELKQHLWYRAIDECDTFFFIWNTFQANYSDFATLKKLGKKIITLFVGSDVRWVPAMEQELRIYDMPPTEFPKGYHNPGDLPVQNLQYLRIAERFSDVIYSHPGHAQLALRPYMAGIVPIDLTMFSENSKQREHPLVVHAPSNNATKGTKYVLPVIERLHDEGIPFEFDLIENLVYTEAIRRYQEADILIGQLMAPGGGKQEREALACGTVVLSSLRPEYPQKFISECPIVDVSPDTLYDVLKAHILDHPGRIELAPKGRAFIEKHHDVNNICDEMLTHVSLGPQEPDYVPTFFREKYMPENPFAARLYNTYTRFVQDCDWYKTYVRPGERDGLIF